MTLTLHWTLGHHCRTLNREPNRCSNQSNGGRTGKAKIQSLARMFKTSWIQHWKAQNRERYNGWVELCSTHSYYWGYSQCPSQSQLTQFLLTSSPTFSKHKQSSSVPSCHSAPQTMSASVVLWDLLTWSCNRSTVWALYAIYVSCFSTYRRCLLYRDVTGGMRLCALYVRAS